jgi:hypothetical protein
LPTMGFLLKLISVIDILLPRLPVRCAVTGVKIVSMLVCNALMPLPSPRYEWALGAAGWGGPGVYWTRLVVSPHEQIQGRGECKLAYALMEGLECMQQRPACWTKDFYRGVHRFLDTINGLSSTMLSGKLATWY